MIGTKPEFKELWQSADYTKEKHVPVIDAPDTVKKGEMFRVSADIGSVITHPNTTAHHIQWIALYFQPEGDKYSYEIGRGEFLAHGASVQGADTSTLYTHHEVSLKFKTDKPGMIFASSSCNIHGLWQGSKELKVE
ncbi:MAG: class II SORL domain-containing protein [Endomicrobiales bacterium]